MLALIQHLADMSTSNCQTYLAQALTCLAQAPDFRPATTDAALQALSDVLHRCAAKRRVSTSLARAAVPALTSLMQSTSCPAAVLLGAFAAFALSELPEIQVILAEAALPAVISLLQNARRPAGQSLAAMSLVHASLNARARAPIAWAALPSLAAMLLAGRTSGMPDFVMQVSEAALSVLSGLTLDVDDHRGAVATATLPALVSIIQQTRWPGSDCRERAACVLQHLAASENIWVEQRVADAALPELVKLMRSTDDRRERLMAVEAVSSLAASPDVKIQHQVHAVAHAALMLQAQQNSDKENRRAAKRALDRLQPSCCVVM